MGLSTKYILRLIGGWALLGGISFFCASSYIGGAATLFILFAFASWSIFPLLHVGIAVLVSKKSKQDPSLAVFVISVFVVFLLLISLLLSGLFNFV